MELKRHEAHTKRAVSGNFTKDVTAVFSCLVVEESTSIYPLHPSAAGSPCSYSCSGFLLPLRLLHLALCA